MPKVTVAIPLYNNVDTVGKAVESVLAQTFQDFEIIVVDDCSTDGASDVVAKMAKSDPRIKLLYSEKNGGGGTASRRGFQEATGEYTAMLDADDWYQPPRLQRLVEEADRHTADLVFDNLSIFDHVLGKVVETTHYGLTDATEPVTYSDLVARDSPYKKHPIGYAKPLVRKAFLNATGINYMAGYRVSYDFTLLSELTLSGARSFVIPDPNYVYVHRVSPTSGRISPHSRSTTRFVEHKESMDRIMSIYGERMGDKNKAALEARQATFTTLLTTQEVRNAIFARDYVKAMKLIAGHPAALLLAASTTRHRMLRRLRLALAA